MLLDKRRVVARAANKSGGNAFHAKAMEITEIPHCAFSAGQMAPDAGQLVSRHPDTHIHSQIVILKKAQQEHRS
jgi:hypothetical protein